MIARAPFERRTSLAASQVPVARGSTSGDRLFSAAPFWPAFLPLPACSISTVLRPGWLSKKAASEGCAIRKFWSTIRRGFLYRALFWMSGCAARNSSSCATVGLEHRSAGDANQGPVKEKLPLLFEGRHDPRDDLLRNASTIRILHLKTRPCTIWSRLARNASSIFGLVPRAAYSRFQQFPSSTIFRSLVMIGTVIPSFPAGADSAQGDLGEKERSEPATADK